MVIFYDDGIKEENNFNEITIYSTKLITKFWLNIKYKSCIYLNNNYIKIESDEIIFYDFDNFVLTGNFKILKIKRSDITIDITCDTLYSDASKLKIKKLICTRVNLSYSKFNQKKLGRCDHIYINYCTNKVLLSNINCQSLNICNCNLLINDLIKTKNFRFYKCKIKTLLSDRNLFLKNHFDVENYSGQRY
jgi:hypothetical protein